ncbi:hypothetical protein R1sor_002737 [Riccia sorocarpa]|uniref:Reverse transcriptase domain-containing protein n=1 Tax=Riccia sorocarpa TaxID=122646 RepID=A0ABD3H319_9MARC
MLDLEKAYDRLSLDFLWEVLGKLGFGDPFINKLRALSLGASGRVQVNSALSPDFPIQRGVRQGCPLAPLLSSVPLILSVQAAAKEGKIKPLTLPGGGGGGGSAANSSKEDVLLLSERFSSSGSPSFSRMRRAWDDYRASLTWNPQVLSIPSSLSFTSGLTLLKLKGFLSLDDVQLARSWSNQVSRWGDLNLLSFPLGTREDSLVHRLSSVETIPGLFCFNSHHWALPGRGSKARQLGHAGCTCYDCGADNKDTLHALALWSGRCEFWDHLATRCGVIRSIVSSLFASGSLPSAILQSPSLNHAHRIAALLVFVQGLRITGGWGTAIIVAAGVLLAEGARATDKRRQILNSALQVLLLAIPASANRIFLRYAEIFHS